MAPSFDRRSFVNLRVCDCSICAVGGGGWHISLSQGAVKQIFFSLEEGTLSPALSCVNFQNQLIVQHPNNQMWDSRSKSLISHHTADDLYEGPPWKRIRKRWELPSSNTPEMRDGNRQPDRQKSTELLTNSFTPGTEATWCSCLCAGPWPQFNRCKWMSDSDVNTQNQ